jgi:hypothetical protein
MSHQTKIKSIIKDERAAIKAAKKLGFEVLKNQKWRVYSGMSSRKADIVLRHKDCNFDLALIKQDDGTFEMSTDFYRTSRNRRNMTDIIGKKGGIFQRDVNAIAMADKAFGDGWMVDQTMTEEGIIELDCEISNEQLATLGYGGF